MKSWKILTSLNQLGENFGDFDKAARPAMKEDQWNRIRDFASLVDKMNIICAESTYVYVGCELR